MLIGKFLIWKDRIGIGIGILKFSASAIGRRENYIQNHTYLSGAFAISASSFFVNTEMLSTTQHKLVQPVPKSYGLSVKGKHVKIDFEILVI